MTLVDRPVPERKMLTINDKFQTHPPWYVLKCSHQTALLFIMKAGSASCYLWP